MSKLVTRRATSRKIKTKSGGTRVVNVKSTAYNKRPSYLGKKK